MLRYHLLLDIFSFHWGLSSLHYSIPSLFIISYKKHRNITEKRKPMTKNNWDNNTRNWDWSIHQRSVRAIADQWLPFSFKLPVLVTVNAFIAMAIFHHPFLITFRDCKLWGQSMNILHSHKMWVADELFLLPGGTSSSPGGRRYYHLCCRKSRYRYTHDQRITS